MESNAAYNITGSASNSSHSLEGGDPYRLRLLVSFVSVFLVSLFGMAGNGTVIWILGCHMKENSFTTYVLNLSVADFALLTNLILYNIHLILYFFLYMEYSIVLMHLIPSLFLFTFSTSHFLLAAISIDRCVCLFFPLWHKCRRPPYLSTIVCSSIWILTFLISAIDFALTLSIGYDELWYHQFLLNAVLCMPAMSISTTAMLVKVCFLSSHHKRGKLLTAISLTLLFFLFLGFPMNALWIFLRYDIPASSYTSFYALMGATLNSAINPVIYFLVGRDKKAPTNWRIKDLFQKLFREEEEVETRLQTCLYTTKAAISTGFQS